MARRRRHREQRPPPSPDAPDAPTLVRLAVAASAALRGCTSRPDITHDRGVVRVAHDLDCPAADTGTALAIAPARARTTTHQRRPQ